MKKNLRLLTFLFGMGVMQLSAQAQNENESPRLFGNSKFMLTGNAEVKYTNDTATSNFGDLAFKPIFLWHLTDKLFIEAETEIGTGPDGVELVMEYANMCYFVNDYLTIHGGRFLPKFGAYRGRLGESFVDRFAINPVGFGDGVIGPMIETGIGAQGGIPLGSAKMSYDFWISNGPQLIDGSADPGNAGQFDYEAYSDNNKSKAIGGRIGLVPFSNSSLELGVSFENAKGTGAQYSAYEKTGVQMMAFDLEYFKNISAIKSTVRLIGEYKTQKVDKAYYPVEGDSTSYTFDNSANAMYGMISLRPSNADNKFVRNLELGFRYSSFDRPKEAKWGSDKMLTQTAVTLDYWLRWNSLVKFTYGKNSDAANLYVVQLVYGF